MTKRAKITIKELQFLKLGKIPVIDPSGEADFITYPIVNGVMLVPMSDAHLFNLSASTLRKMMDRGEIKKYNVNGTIKKGSASTKTFFDPYEFYQNQ